MFEELLKLFLEIICGSIGHLFLKLFRVKKDKIDWIDEIVGFIILLLIIFGIIFLIKYIIIDK